MYKGLVPYAVTAGMLDTACHIPYDAAALVDVEALETVEVPRNTITPLTLVSQTPVRVSMVLLTTPGFIGQVSGYHYRSTNAQGSQRSRALSYDTVRQ